MNPASSRAAAPSTDSSTPTRPPGNAQRPANGSSRSLTTSAWRRPVATMKMIKSIATAACGAAGASRRLGSGAKMSARELEHSAQRAFRRPAHVLVEDDFRAHRLQAVQGPLEGDHLHELTQLARL